MILVFKYQRYFELFFYSLHLQRLMEKRKKANFDTRNIFDKIIEDKKAIAKSIRDGVRKETIEKERDVRFVTPV